MSGILIGIITFILGFLSNAIGAVLGYAKRLKSELSIKKIMGLTAGITTAVICFELLQESFEIGNKYLVALFVIIGTVFVLLIDIVVSGKKNSYRNQTLVVIIAMAAHNITEGLAIGSAFDISKAVGISLLISIMAHNIPEGMIIGIMNRKEKKSIGLSIVECLIIGLFLGTGALIGVELGKISSQYIMPSLAMSAGAMLYIVACELIPSMAEEKMDIGVGLTFIVGMLIGSLMCIN